MLERAGKGTLAKLSRRTFAARDSSADIRSDESAKQQSMHFAPI